MAKPAKSEHKLTYKTFAAKLEGAEPESRIVTAVISTGALDRDAEIMVPSGAQLGDYRKNPVVLWAHQMGEPPIGKAVWIKHDRDRGAIKAKVKFADTALGDEVFRLFQGGYLRAFSVGFDPYNSEYKAPTDVDLKRKPEWEGARRVWTKWDLLEFSAVPVPSNPEAIAMAVSKGLVNHTRDDFDLLETEEETELGMELGSGPQPESVSVPIPRRRVLSATVGVPRSEPRRRQIIRRESRLPSATNVVKWIRNEIDRLRGRIVDDDE